ncbi:hypothetical protein WMF31_08570 [Sorangium sp. So ce1036]|uniref:hypothetical protein n=1 Tax=Sorangium sp. So ce1036 TaxID=3133328 RepID=UPI003F097941
MLSRSTLLIPLLGLGLLAMAGAAGCSSSSGSNGDAGAAAGGSVGGGDGVGGGGDGGDDGATAGSGAGGGDGADGGGSGEAGGLSYGGGSGGAPPVTPDTACVATVAEATLTKRPVDIIFMIDNSESMANEIISVQNNINDSFAAIIAASGIDYRVIMLAQHGDPNVGDSVCIGAPLSAASCDPIPEQPGNNPPTFYHYSYENRSHNAICNMLASYSGGVVDEYGAAPLGWSEWTRADSLKVFVVITDDNVGCQTSHLERNVYLDDRNTAEAGEDVAARVEEMLLGLEPRVFGDASAPNYIFHSIVGLSENSPATDAYPPEGDTVLGTCGTAVAPGTGYQALSRRSGGLRFPLCETSSYDVVFQAIAEGVITGAVVDCEFEVPDSPPGEIIDLATVVVQYTPGDGSEARSFKQVAGVDACEAGSFYIESDTIKLCPDACQTVQADAGAQVDVLYGCDPEATR